jgi:hypothetical protein
MAKSALWETECGMMLPQSLSERSNSPTSGTINWRIAAEESTAQILSPVQSQYDTFCTEIFLLPFMKCLSISC